MKTSTVIRAAGAGIVALVLSATIASAQGKTPKPVVIPKTVLKAMVANKPKSKAPLGAKAGLVKRKGVVAAKPLNQGPTSVREVPKKN
jgi:hypothetical protein